MSAAIAGAAIIAASAALPRARYFIAVPHPVEKGDRDVTTHGEDRVSDEIKTASELATAKLEAMSAALHPPPPASPTTPGEARARLHFLAADKEWGAKLLA